MVIFPPFLEKGGSQQLPTWIMLRIGVGVDMINFQPSKRATLKNRCREASAELFTQSSLLQFFNLSMSYKV